MSILLFLAILLILVLVHEFGHFIVAKRAGIRVDEFAFGFPPRLFSIKKGETTYSFNALPIGGYVKIYGENPDDVTHDRKRSFTAQSRLTQARVIVAGVVFNILLAWGLISATLMIGIPASSDPEAGYVVENARLMVTEVQKGKPADLAHLVPGDYITQVSDGSASLPINTPQDLSGFIGTREGKSVTIIYEHHGEQKAVVINPISGIVEGRAAIGIAMDMVGTYRLPPHKALYEGIKKTYEYTQMTAVGILGFIHDAVVGHADFTQVTGPVGIVRAVDDAAGVGFTNVLLFAALISINLAVINVLPFPALDGGRLLFIIIEAIMRKQIPAKIANALNIAGFTLLMLMMVAVTWHDIVKLS